MGAGRPFAWEKSYPAGVRWDAPIATSTIPELLDRVVAQFGDRAALEYRDRRISYRELAASADRAAAAFLRLGTNAPVALYLPNTPYHPVSFFGAMRAGKCAVQLSPLDAKRELAHKLSDSGARTIVTTNLFGLAAKALEHAAAGHVDRVIVGDDAAWGAAASATDPIPDHKCVLAFERLMADSPPPSAWPAVSPNDFALLQFTGATTGVPKAAMLTHGNLTAAVSSYLAWVGGQRQPDAAPERVVMVLPLFHIYGLTSVLLRHLASGNELLLRSRFDVEAVLHDIEVKRATAFFGVPTMWIALLDHPDLGSRDLGSLRRCACGGAPLPVAVAERCQRVLGRPLTNGWGMTETAPAATSSPLDGRSKPGSIGLPLPGIVVEVVALDDSQRVLAPGEVGELRVKGANVMRGYWNQPAETAAAFADGGYLSGDIGYMDEDGFFFIVDRKKDMIISGGFNVYPQVIENAIHEHPDVEEALVIGVADTYRGEAAKAFVKLRRGAPQLTVEALRAFLADKLGRHEMPAALEMRDALPRTSVGKLSKEKLIAEERRKQAGGLTAAPEAADGSTLVTTSGSH